MADSLKKILEDSQNLVAKGVDTSDISTTANSNTLRPPLDLTPGIIEVNIKPTPMVDLFLPKAERGIGDSFTFNVNEYADTTPINPRNAVYADGVLPNDITPTFQQKTVAFRSLGYSSFVTGLAAAQGRDIVELEEYTVRKTMQLLKESLEWLFFWGSTSTLNSAGLPQFPGLDELITTNVVDANGSALYGVTGKNLIDQAAQKIAQWGGMATHLVADIGSAININNTYNGNERVIVTEAGTGNITWGNEVAQVRTVAGTLRIVQDFFLNPGNTFILPNGATSTPTGATRATVFVISEPYIFFKNLQNMTLEYLGKRTDKDEFFVKIYTALKVTAERFMAKIINVDTTLQDSV